LLFSFSRHLDVMHHHAYLTLHVVVKSKIIWHKIYNYFSRMVFLALLILIKTNKPK
jgi:hypothetical protein